MLGLCGRGSGAARGLRALGLLLQRGEGGGCRCRSAPCGNVYSSFLEGKDGLGGIKALFSVGLSASCIVYGGVEGAMGACLELCNGRVPARLLAVCIEGEGMHMVVYRSRCPRTAHRDQIAHTAAQSTARERETGSSTEARHTRGVERTEAMPAAKKACRWRWVALEDTRSSTKRLSKERRGRRCAYAWENAARTEQSRLGECEAAVVGEQTRRSRNRVVVLLSHTLNELVGWAWLAERSDGRDGGFGVSWCDQLESRGVEPLPPSASRV
jgi:hypothetical protein